MSTTTAPIAGRIPEYEYSAPTEAEVVASLRRVFGPERGTESWARACRAASLPVGGVSTPALVERAAQALAADGGAAATVARSVAIRLRTYNRLAARSGAAGRATS